MDLLKMAHAKCRNQMVLANTESRIICRIRVHTLQRSNGATHNKRIITIQTKFIRLLCDIIASFCGFGERFVATFCGRSVKLFSAASIWLQFGWNLSRMKMLEMKRFVCTSHGHGRACNMHDGDMTKCRERERTPVMKMEKSAEHKSRTWLKCKTFTIVSPSFTS